MRGVEADRPEAPRTSSIALLTRARVLLAPFASDLPAWLQRFSGEADEATSPRLFRTDSGVGPRRAVLLHGIGGTHRYWTAGSAAWPASAYRVVMVDLLGFGLSPRPWVRYTGRRHLAALRRTLADVPRPLTLIGHSLGAVLALMYAARYPKDVSALVLLSLPHFGGLTGVRRWFSGRRGSWIYTNVWAMALACLLTRRVAGRVLPHIVHSIPRELVVDMVKHNMASWTTTLWDVLYRQDVGELADALDPALPVLLLHGDADRTAPLAQVQALACGRAQWSLRVMLGVDHHPWLRCPERCASEIQSWLDVHA
jgi:pimeloyl-ACP methyl ester carboxylesterase